MTPLDPGQPLAWVFLDSHRGLSRTLRQRARMGFWRRLWHALLLALILFAVFGTVVLIALFGFLWYLRVST